MTDQALRQELEQQRDLMMAVATGGPRIDTVNGSYVERRTRIREGLQERAIDDPNPFGDLWAWYGKWSSGDLPTYQSRRTFIGNMYQPILDSIGPQDARTDRRPAEPTGWAKVDRDLSAIRRILSTARTEPEFQTVGLRCREILISLAQQVYEPARHRTLDGIEPSPTDAKRMLEAYLAVELAGKSHSEARRHTRAAMDFAVALQHERSATYRHAAICAEMTASVVDIIAIASGRRDPS